MTRASCSPSAYAPPRSSCRGGFQMIDFRDLESELCRLSDRMLDYPRIELVVTESPANIALLARRISTDLEILVSEASP